MLGNNRGRDYNVYEGGERVLSVRYLTPTEPSDCCMCGRSTFDHFAVPYYCGPVRSGKSEGGYAPACQRCYDRWARWDDALEEYDSWLAVLREGARGVAMPPMPLPPVDGDVLPAIGSKVSAHYARPDEWREQTVIGYYVWPDLNGSKNLHRVFLRLRDDEGWTSARMLGDVKPAPGVKGLAHG